MFKKNKKNKIHLTPKKLKRLKLSRGKISASQTKNNVIKPLSFI